jgi:CMP/dCMP kinase
MIAMAERTTITIARQMGSGGAYVGQRIAKHFKLRYIDREVLRLAAESLGVEEAAVEASRERLTSFWERIFGPLTLLPPEAPYTPPPMRRFTDEELFRKQVAALKLIAAREDCVIIGYGGAHVLPPHQRMVNLYFHAPLKFRLRRLMQLYNLTDVSAAGRMIRESDETRRRYFTQMTGKDWACADNYHLCINTSLFPLDELADRLILFIERKLKSEQAKAAEPASDEQLK